MRVSYLVKRLHEMLVCAGRRLRHVPPIGAPIGALQMQA